MMETKTKITRSRFGCNVCKKLKKKCDEGKPSCAYCLKRGCPCDYTKTLIWGGRPFKSKKSNSEFETPGNEFKEYKNDSKNKPNQGIKFVHQNFTTDNKSYIESYATPLSTGSTSNKKRRDEDFEDDQQQKKQHINDSQMAATSPQSFLTPHGYSILQENQIESPQSIYNEQIDPLIVNQSQRTKTNPSFVYQSQEVIDYPPSFNQLENEIGRITDGEVQFQLQNSDIFQDFLHEPNITKTSSDSSSVENYSQDLAKIEEYMPTPTNLMDVMPFIYRPAFNKQLEPDLDFELNEEQKVEKLLNSIPSQLLPMPSLLLDVPFYRNLLHFWINIASAHFVPVPSDIYIDNPFKTILPQMAMQVPSILTVLLAFSAKIRSQLIGDSGIPESVIDVLLSRSCSELVKLLQDKKTATSDEALATALLLSCFEIFNSKDFSRHRAHTIGARQIIKARSFDPLAKNRLSNSEKDIKFFLLRWFVYTDVIGALSSTKNSDEYLLISDIDKYEPINSFNTIYKVDDEHAGEQIDCLTGFDLKYLSHFAKITLVARKTNEYLSQPGANRNTIPSEIICQALEIKEALQDTCVKDHDFIQMNQEKLFIDGMSSKIQEIEILKYTNKIFCDAGIIHLYRRVLLIPRESHLVQESATNIGLLARQRIPPKSPTEICLIFCFFTAACETLDKNLQKFFEERFIGLGELGNINARKGLQIMRECWNSGVDWIEAATTMDLDFALF
ncbi:uncharacterized protein KGF55_000387 [Candida pseudojiufengensis]|uniref:uncharacterized protein n=1 Tax=Candida pseudojiufengensis TaxID=497109 RepID=UPI00222540F7|nr:uncharacterized protein KGF55_000387 [Candida pseudojiufengensis]KAI5966978.1 hypothetical protein KGF55_000387 [Candida pseudojiufengensis]